MKKRIIIISVIAVVLMSIGVLAYTQADNIMGIFYSFKYSDEEIEKKMVENNLTYAEGVEEVIGHPIREFTEEEEKQIKDGVATKEEIFEKIIKEELEKASNLPLDKNTEDAVSNQTGSGKEAASEKNNSKSQPKTPSAPKSNNAGVSVPGGNSSYYMSQLYSLKSKYIGMLDGMVSSAISEYKALPASQRTRSKQLEIGASYASRAAGLEGQCDAEVAAVLRNLESELRKEGKSTGVISTINSAYASEKQLKRAYYLNMFK